MEDEGEIAWGEIVGADVAFEEGQGGIGCDVWALQSEGCGVAREDRCLCVEIELAIDVGEAFEEPAAEEAGAASDEEALVSYLFPEGSGVGEDEIEIRGGDALWHGGVTIIYFCVERVFMNNFLVVNGGIRETWENDYNSNCKSNSKCNSNCKCGESFAALRMTT